VQASLAAVGVNVSIVSAPSARLDLESRGIDEMIRASVHYFNTDDEIERLVATVST
jgi:selenocysteine lyase/cysteine desulfurase